jgi:DnaJ-class molecular chaperone
MDAMTDPYAALGVERSASDEEIKAAFKKLARQFHPDLHPDDKAAEARFKQVSSAYDLLKDKEKRRRFDAGEIDASGQETPQHRYYRDYAGRPDGSHAQQDGFASEEDLEEFLARAFGGGYGGRAGGRARHAEFRARGADASYVLPVGFLEAANGAERTVTLPDGKSLKVKIPEGAEDRQMLRLKGQGMPGFGGGPAGDAYVELHVEPHAFFRRKDDNIHLTVPVTLKEAVLGGTIAVPTVDGQVNLKVPKGSNTGTKMRLKEKGIRNRRSGKRGHQYVELQVVLPEGEEPGLADFLKEWQPRKAQNPRKDMLK